MENTTNPPLRLGMIGCGVVGTGLLDILESHPNTIARRAKTRLEIVAVAVRSLDKSRDPRVPAERWTTDVMSVATHPDVEVVVELMGGIDLAERAVRAALEAGKHVVTANKALIAERGQELFALAAEKGCDLYFEAAVAGGVPVIRTIREAMAADRVLSIRGIVNGTSNYILSTMATEGAEFADALARAQELGFAEADPTLDIGGGDAQHKLAILATLAFGAYVSPDRIPTESIANVSRRDMELAKNFGFAVRPLAIARRIGTDRLDLRVHPALVPRNSQLGRVSGALNAVLVTGAKVGDVFVSGLGAGAHPTAVSVLGDIIDIARNVWFEFGGREWEFSGDLNERIQSLDELECPFYVRLEARDEPGVLSKITGVLSNHEISIDKLNQTTDDDTGAQICMITHPAIEKNVRTALAEISAMGLCRTHPFSLRVVED